MTLPTISLPDFFQDRKIILIGVAIVVVLGGLLLAALSVFKKTAPATISFWGLWEDAGVYQEVITDYQKAHPSVTIKYAKQSPINYRDRVTTVIAGENGPDIFLIHNTWLPMFKANLSPLPPDIYSPAAYKSVFYPVVGRDFIASGNAYAVPLSIDDLALYVNSDILTAAGVAAPTTWDGADSFVSVAQKMTVRDANGRIKTAGAAMGTASNVDHWQDIVALMMLQAGVDLNSDPGSQKAQDAMAFYTSFATTQKVWDETLDASTLAFSQGKVAMYFGPSWRFFDLKTMNPNLNFKVVPVPQLTGAEAINFATYWAAAVSKKSKSAKTAWDFLKFISGKDELTKIYSAEARMRAFGEPYSRTDLANSLLTDANAGVFVNAAPKAQSWYLASFTNDGDTGINSQIGGYYKKAIDSMLRGTDARSAMETVAKGVAQVLTSFGVATK